jgi:hypothetical protein
VDILLRKLKQGSYRLRVKINDSNVDGGYSRSISFNTPKAPLNISMYPPVFSMTPDIRPITVTYNDKIINRKRKDNIVTLYTESAHGLKIKDKVTITGMGGSAVSFNGTYTISGVNVKSKTISYKKKGAAVAKATKGDVGNIAKTEPSTTVVGNSVVLSVNSQVLASLEWTATVRDVVFFLTKSATKVSGLSGAPLRYLTEGGQTVATAVTDQFSTTPKSYPSGLTRKRSNIRFYQGLGVYEYYYVIVRYYKVGSSWVGFFPMIKANAEMNFTSINTPATPKSTSDIIISAGATKK